MTAMRVLTRRSAPWPSTRRSPTLALVLVTALAGCSGMSGIGGETRYACQAPVGVACDSVSGNYANSLRSAMPVAPKPPSATGLIPPASPEQVQRPPSVRRSGPPTALEDLTTVATPTSAQRAAALRSQPRILRMWTKPWEDADGDLHDQGYVYVQIDNGRWQLDHVQRLTRDAFAPLRPPVQNMSGAAVDAEAQPPRPPTADLRQSPGAPEPSSATWPTTVHRLQQGRP